MQKEAPNIEEQWSRVSLRRHGKVVWMRNSLPGEEDQDREALSKRNHPLCSSRSFLLEPLIRCQLVDYHSLIRKWIRELHLSCPLSPCIQGSTQAVRSANRRCVNWKAAIFYLGIIASIGGLHT